MTVASRARMSKWSIIAIVIATSVAVAGKREREQLEREAIPAARGAEANFKAACHCPLAIAIDDSIQSSDQITAARYIAEEVSHNAAHYCTDAASRKAICKMHTLAIAASTRSSFAFEDDCNGIATTDGHYHPTWDEMTKAIDR
jgi:hypothetical protein